MGSCVSWPCYQGRSGGGYGATRITICVQLAREATWWPRSSHKSRIGFPQWLMSCWLLQLNPGARGNHLNSQIPWVSAWLLVTRVCPVYLVKESFYFGGIYLLLGCRWAGKGGRVLRWEGMKGVWVEWSGKLGKVYEWSELTRWERWEDNEVAQLEPWEGSEVAIWERWEGSEQGRWDGI